MDATTTISKLPMPLTFSRLAAKVKESLWSRINSSKTPLASTETFGSLSRPQADDEDEVAMELMRQKVEALNGSLEQEKRGSDIMRGRLEATVIAAEKETHSHMMEKKIFEKRESAMSAEHKNLLSEVESLRTSLVELKKTLSSINDRYKETKEELAKVRAMSLSSSDEVKRLEAANKELEVSHEFLKDKKASFSADIVVLRQAVKSLKYELATTGTELTKRTLEVTHAKEKMKIFQEALQDSKALVKATSDAAGAESKRSAAFTDIISTLRKENLDLNGKIDQQREEHSVEISKLHEDVGRLDVEKRRIELENSSLAEEIHTLKETTDSPPPYAYEDAPRPRYAPLELREVDEDSITTASLPVTPVGKRKAEGGEGKKTKKIKTKKMKG